MKESVQFCSLKVTNSRKIEIVGGKYYIIGDKIGNQIIL